MGRVNHAETRFRYVNPSVTVFGHAAIEGAPAHPGSEFIIQDVMDRYNEGREVTTPLKRIEKHPYRPHELKTPTGNINKVARFLAAPVLNSYGRETALVDARKASRTDRGTDSACEKLDVLARNNLIGFVIFAWGHDETREASPRLSTSKIEDRVGDIKGKVALMDLPTIELEVVAATSDYLDMVKSSSNLEILLAEDGVIMAPQSFN